MNRTLALISFLLFLTLVQLSAQTKRALVIGVGEQEDKRWKKINGDKDVTYVLKMLRNVGYTDIRTLVNKQATKNGIVAAFKKLADQCGAGDIVYVHFSGHGQQVTDVNGDEGKNDGWDEAWIPYDAYLKYDEKRYRGEKHLIDDETNSLLTAIRKKIGNHGKMFVVVDACHSGDSTRDIDKDETVRGVKDEFVIPMKKRGNSRKAPELWLTLSACKDYQLNQEMKEPKVGKLTYALYTLSGKGSVTFEAVQLFMKDNRSKYAQTPILSGETATHKISDFLK